MFVHWAAAEFDWPGHTEADLFAVNKVLNEPDFAPLMVLHDLSMAARWSDRVVLLADGRVEVEGTPEEAFSSQDLRVSQFVHGEAGERMQELAIA